jgi:hypothetical protein
MIHAFHAAPAMGCSACARAHLQHDLVDKPPMNCFLFLELLQPYATKPASQLSAGAACTACRARRALEAWL